LVKVGVKQEDALSTLLFNLVIEKVIRDKAERCCIELNGNMTILMYVDNIIIINNTQLEVIQILKNIIQVRKKTELIVNEAKKKRQKMNMVHHMHC